MNKIILNIIILLVIVLLVICGLVYSLQEKMIFYPERLDTNFKFRFDQPFEEINIRTRDNLSLNGLLFTTPKPKGLIFYLHGNAGSNASWADVANTYTSLGYDVFLLDYRGYGKSEGKINSQKQLFDDVQLAFNEMKKRYDEQNIIVLGYSIGTGPAAKVASVNHPKLLILQAPYYSLTDLVKKLFPYLPTFLLKYKLETYKYIRDCKMPIVIFHGNRDEVIYYNSSIKLQKVLKPTDSLVTLYGQGHNGITENAHYRETLRTILH